MLFKSSQSNTLLLTPVNVQPRASSRFRLLIQSGLDVSQKFSSWARARECLLCCRGQQCCGVNAEALLYNKICNGISQSKIFWLDADIVSLWNYLSCMFIKVILKIKYLNVYVTYCICYSFSIDVRAAAVSCLKNILATKSGSEFWEVYKNKADPMLIYLQPFRMSRKKVLLLIYLIYMAYGVDKT